MLTFESAKNPTWANEKNNAINLIVKFEEFAEEIPFTATSFDTESHGIELFNRAFSGEFGEISPCVVKKSD